MKKKLPIFVLAAVAAAVSIFYVYSYVQDLEAMQLKRENTLTIQLSTGGPVLVEMYPDIAPSHVARIKELARSGFYDGVVFHRVIDGFMAQTGDPTGTGSGGSGQNIDAEFNETPHLRGILSMARAQDENSADSQFFFVLDNAPHLDGQYTAWGNVVEGMEYVDAIPKGPKADNGAVPEDERGSIVSMKVLADIDEDD